MQKPLREAPNRGIQKLAQPETGTADVEDVVGSDLEFLLGRNDRPDTPGGVATAATAIASPPSADESSRFRRTLQLQRTIGNAAVSRNLQRKSAPVVAPEEVPEEPGAEEYGSLPDTNALPLDGGDKPTEVNTTAIQRISVDDVVPDFILSPIKGLVSKGKEFVSGLSPKADAAAEGAKGEASGAAVEAEAATGSKVAAEKSGGAAATAEAQAKSTAAQATAGAAKAAAATKVSEIKKGVQVAETGTDPVKTKLNPGAAKAAGGAAGTGAAGGAADAGTWNCDEAAIAAQVSGVKKTILNGVTSLVKSVVPESVLEFAANGINKAKQVVDSVKKGVTAAKQAVTQFIDEKTKPIREMVDKAQKYVTDKIDKAKNAIRDAASFVAKKAAEKWSKLKDKVTGAVKRFIDKAKNGVGNLVDKAKSLAGRFWGMLPGWLKKGLTGAAAALAAPVVLAYKAIDATVDFVEKKASWLREKAGKLADDGVKWLGEKYKSARDTVVKVGQAIGQGAAWVKDTAVGVGTAVYNKADEISGGRLTRWKKAAEEKAKELRGEVCAVTGAAAGPCVERFIPEPVGENSSFANLTTKADIQVPIKGIPCTLQAGASMKVERTAKVYKVTLTGEVFGGVKLEKKGGGGEGGGNSASVSVEGTLPESAKRKAGGMMALGGQGAPGSPPIPIPVGGGAPAAPTAAGAPVPAGGQVAPAGGGGAPAGGGGGEGGAEVSAQAGRRGTMSFTFEFDATADKTTCDGLGGLTALMASQGAAAVLPAPFSSIASMGGQLAFADKLTGWEAVSSTEAEVSAKVGGGGAELSGSAKAEQGVSVGQRTDEETKHTILTAKLFRGITGEAALSFAPGDISLGSLGGSLGGRSELGITFDMNDEKVNGSFKQSLTGSITISLTGGINDAVSRLPSVLRESARGRLQSVLSSVKMSDVTQASVGFELASNMDNLASLASKIDSELNKGSGASASALWGAIASYLKDPSNCYTTYQATLTLTEKVLGVKAEAGSGKVSGSAEAELTRGQEIKLAEGTTKPKGS